jgi:TRAP-type C4-dicarboxylate transport system permease small subunit
MKIDKNSTLGRFLGHVMPGVIRPLHVLWHEVIGFLFLVFAVWLGSSALRTLRSAGSEAPGLGRITISFILPVVLAYFGITSFLRARKISRS